MCEKAMSFFELLEKKPAVNASPGNTIPASRVLVLAPHQDDEALGCGGTIIRYLQQGISVTILYFTDGRYGVTNTDIGVRKAEALAAWRDYEGLRQVFWDYEDSKLCNEDLQQRLRDFIEDAKPDIIFTPWILDRHLDHRFTTIFLYRVLEEYENFNGIVAFYEVMYPLYANNTVNITRQFDQKLKVIDAFESQIKLYNIKEIILGLNMYRANAIPLASIKAVECFFICEREVFQALMNTAVKG